MNKNFLFILIFSVIKFTGLSQSTDFPKNFVIFGTDFTLAKIVTKNSYNPQSVVKIDIPRLNTEMIKICNIYSSKFRANSLIIDTSDVCINNASISPELIITDKRFIFTNSDTSVRQILKNYNTRKYGEGIGFLLVMEKVDEIDDRESFYILMFDLQTKKVIHCEKVESKLSKVKDYYGSGWFSWKTVIFKTISAMDDIYDFWDNYPITEPINIGSAISISKNENKIIPVKKLDTLPGIKNTKMAFINCSLTAFNTNLEPKYNLSFSTLNNGSTNYGIIGFFAGPKYNAFFEYGLSKKIAIALSAGYEKSTIIWGDTLNNTENYTDTWIRYQISLKCNYYFIARPKVHLYMGPQLAYNIIHVSSTGSSIYSSRVTPLLITGQVNFGFTYFIKKVIGINAAIGFGFGSCDILTVGLGYKF